MKDYYQKSIEALQLAGMSESTQKAYTRAVRQLVDFYDKTPDKIGEDQLQEYFLHRKNVDGWSPATMRICYSGIKFFYLNVLKHNWHIFDILRAEAERRLPCVLSVEEVHRILNCVKTFHNYVFLTTAYSHGLRLQEALHLQVSDIDSDRMMVHVHRGKGAKDRYVPLPHETLNLMRQYWVTHKNPVLIFPALGRNGKGGSTANTPMAKASVQGAFRSAKFAAGIKKRRVTIHTLRHSYATHLLEQGLDLRAIQGLLGHRSLRSTIRYLHLTQSAMKNVQATVNGVMGDL